MMRITLTPIDVAELDQADFERRIAVLQSKAVRELKAERDDLLDEIDENRQGWRTASDQRDSAERRFLWAAMAAGVFGLYACLDVIHHALPWLVRVLGS